MIIPYIIPPLVFGTALSYMLLIHHFWLRDAVKEEDKHSVHIGESTIKVIPSTALPFAKA